MNHKSGFVNIIGNPNVGKSTFINAIVGKKISIITHKAQTTRHRIFGILNTDEYQIVFSDTPGVIKPNYELQKSMMGFVKESFADADIIIYMVEIGEKTLKDEDLFEKIKNTNIPVLLLLNKIDNISQDKVVDALDYWKLQVPNAMILPISALNNFNVDVVLDKVLELLPESEAYFSKDAITDKPERFFVNEKIREKILIHYKKEIPYSVEVVTDSFKESDKIIHIDSVIYVERDSQKGIIIGHKGLGIQRIGTEARKDLELFFDKKIHLKLFVKVDKNWRQDKKKLTKYNY